MNKHHQIQPLDAERIDRNQTGNHPQTTARIRSLIINRSFLGTRSTITPMKGPNKMGGRV